MASCIVHQHHGRIAPYLSPSTAFDPPPVSLNDVLSELSHNRDLRHPDDLRHSPSPKKAFGAVNFASDGHPLGSRARVRAEARASTRAENVALHSTALTPKEQENLKLCYRPWFHSRFAKASVALPRQACVEDLRMISGFTATHPEVHVSHARKPPPPRKPQPETWVGCDECGKWRRLAAGAMIDPSAAFVCTMLAGTTCDEAEEDWNDAAQWVETSGASASARASASSSTSRPPSVSPSHAEQTSREGPRSPLTPRSPTRSDRTRKRRSDADVPAFAPPPARRRTSGVGSEDGSSDEAASAAAGRAALAAGTAPAPMSRLEAVIEVLGLARAPMHYDAITQQALKVGLIRFTGSQGTAGESMKAFLNKTIRENKCPSVVNLGKGVYGLRDWGLHDNSRASLPSPLASTKPTSSSSATPSPALRPTLNSSRTSASPAPSLSLPPAAPVSVAPSPHLTPRVRSLATAVEAKINLAAASAVAPLLEAISLAATLQRGLDAAAPKATTSPAASARTEEVCSSKDSKEPTVPQPAAAPPV
mmetsp:Transcript_2442/g.5601  ORF Transcript_2442/g.5601 Transcript_2442/m.5601 type:complete len:536 (-) Transcript_2442:70-1677(-)